VADLPADFYLETVKLVFQDCALAQGRLQWRGRRVVLHVGSADSVLVVQCCG
jgi:poly-beta-hydroxyalkanoate depolymerase